MKILFEICSTIEYDVSPALSKKDIVEKRANVMMLFKVIYMEGKEK